MRKGKSQNKKCKNKKMQKIQKTRKQKSTISKESCMIIKRISQTNTEKR